MGERELMDLFIVHLYGLPNAISRSAKFNKKLSIFITITSIIVTVLILYSYQIKKYNTKTIVCGVDEMYNQPFFIELMSNSSSFKENTVANFKNKIS